LKDDDWQKEDKEDKTKLLGRRLTKERKREYKE
jgi:hypothetical protein